MYSQIVSATINQSKVQYSAILFCRNIQIKWNFIQKWLISSKDWARGTFLPFYGKKISIWEFYSTFLFLEYCRRSRNVHKPLSYSKSCPMRVESVSKYEHLLKVDWSFHCYFLTPGLSRTPSAASPSLRRRWSPQPGAWSTSSGEWSLQCNVLSLSPSPH